MVNSKHIDIFSDSECLSLEAIKAYAANTLEARKMLQVEKHLIDCEICSDAVEGFSLMTDGSAINKRVDKINKRIDALTAKAAPRWKKDYLAYAAAVVGILLVCSTLYVSIKSSVDSNKLISQDINNTLEPKTDKEEKKQGPGSELKVINGKINKKDYTTPVKSTKAQEDITVTEDAIIVEEEVEIEEEMEVADIKEETRTMATAMKADITPTHGIPNESDLLEDEDPAEPITTQTYGQPEVGSVAEEEGQETTFYMMEASGKAKKARKSFSASSAPSAINNSIIPEEDDIYSIVETAPTFEGGEEKLAQYLKANLRYPESAKEKKIEGIVYTTFTVNKDSSISNVKILRPLEPSCDKEALRVINNMPKWIPGQMGGKKVPAQFNLPIKFSFSESK